MRRRILFLFVIVGVGFIVARARRAALAPEPDRDPWSTEPPVALEAHAEAGAAWLEPVGSDCPETHPVKAKMSSGIYHLPGMAAYSRTHPDRWYRDAAAAEADGLRPAKR
jgi:micrococcal nuclease